MVFCSKTHVATALLQEEINTSLSGTLTVGGLTVKDDEEDTIKVGSFFAKRQQLENSSPAVSPRTGVSVIGFLVLFSANGFSK